VTGESAEPEPIRRVITVADAPAVGSAAAELVGRLIAAALADRGVAHVSLAGGTTPRLTYVELELPTWDGVELWFGDERCVGPDDPESNFLMVAESLIPHAPGAVVHRIEGELGPDAAADSYEALIAERIATATAGGVPVLDVNLLGIGPDGHTASLFPGNPAVGVTGRSVVGVRGAPKPPPERVSLTLEVLRAARDTILLAAGESKADAVAGVLAGPQTGTPSSLLARERLTLIVDAAAAGRHGDASPPDATS
jgi:6-phosphogluconolactonase